MPDLAVSSSPLNNVVGDFGASVITWRIPGQETGFIGNFRNVKSGRRTRFVCFEKKHVINWTSFEKGVCWFSMSFIGLTKDVDIHSGSSTTAAVGSFYDVGGGVISCGLGDGHSRVSRFGVN